MIHGREANCRFCTHYLGEQRCQAFASGIPAALWSGEHLHREPYPGDGGIQFEPKRIEMLTLEDIFPEQAEADSRQIA